VRQSLRQLPRRRVPRNFMLDPAVYGRPTREPLVQAYPVLRIATVLTAFFFVLAIALQTFGGAGLAASRTAEVAMEAPRVVTDEVAMQEEPIAGAVVEVTRIVIEEMEAAPMAAEAPPAEGMAEAPAAEPAIEATVEEGAMATVMAADTAVSSPEPSAGNVTGAAAAPQATASLPTPIPTPSPMATAVATGTAVPTRTPDIPRSSEEPTLADRAAPDLLTQYGLATAVPTPISSETTSSMPTSAFPWLPVGLGALFILLAAFTFLARRRIL